ncbi:hypothetical protein J4G33_09560 [Actinotalea sp. BY-33]|uniref:Uncharacterized protein n=1 Tax=Actinotalea soli TaxID=2819234 RepID=A0A939RVW6_9CELL|nr:DUF6226 family protein [Actinotalea soli]MBO1752048.1 hypothetical protein [Actinotalea soli]
METTVADLQALVLARYERLDLPSWPDPRPDGGSPREEEYSRVTDPGRYRIVHERARVWAAVLAEVLGASVEEIVPSTGRDGRPEFDRGLRLTPQRRDALALLLLERDVAQDEADATLAVLEVCVTRPGVVVALQPDCGCDACDSGSQDLLEAVDAAVVDVVGGPFVVLQGRTWHAQWHPGGGSASSDGRGPEFDVAFDLCRRLAAGETVHLPRHTEAFHGSSWLG